MHPSEDAEEPSLKTVADAPIPAALEVDTNTDVTPKAVEAQQTRKDPKNPSRVAKPERPGIHNTGPTDPASLRPSGSVTITTDGTLLENLHVSGTITIDANNVAIRNFRVDATGTSYGIEIKDGHSGIAIEDGEIYGMSSAGILGAGFTARRLYVHDSGADALKVGGTGGPTLVEFCFIEKLGRNPDAHADGNQTRGGSNITFRYNNIYVPFQGTPNYPGAPYKSNAAFMLELEISNFVIEHNWLNGGTYTIYCPSPENGDVFIRNNIFGRDNAGLSEGKDDLRLCAGNCAAWSGNRWEDTGGPAQAN